VHAFATDPTRGIYILMILGVFIGGSLLLYAARASAMEAKGVFAMISRETGLVVNNILLAVAAFVVFIGTIWPLVAEMFFARKLSVGAPFFDAAFTPFMVVLALVLPVGSMLPWKRAKIGRVLKALVPAAVLAVAVFLLVWTLQTQRTILGPVGFLLGTWLVAGAAIDLISRTGRGPLGERVMRALRLPRADWGKAVSHAGLGITMAGVSGIMAWQIEDIRVGYVGQPFEVAGYEITLTGVEKSQGPNYLTTIGHIDVKKNGRLVAKLDPEKRFYPVQQMPTTEASIDKGFWRDLYLVIGDPQDGGGWAVRTFIKPFTNWIWVGSMIMAFGGFLSLTDRRYRVAAGATRAQLEGVAAE